MKDSLLQLIVCPLCGDRLASEIIEEDNAGEIVSGLLKCSACGAPYPVIGGIARLLPPALQSMLRDMHPEFFRIHAKRLGTQFKFGQDRDDAILAQHDTAKSFGYEWQEFHEMLPDYEPNFRWYFERFDTAAFAGKSVLDAGCGTGRHTFHMARSGAREVIAMDLSQAIEVAARNNKDNSNTHFIQADIYHPPFRPESFDLIYSLGVLHHLPDPERGFRSLLPLVRPNGFLNIYLYWDLEGEAIWRRAALRVVTWVRQITTRLPHSVLKKLSWLIAATFEAAFVFPARILGSFTLTRRLADWIPLGHYRRYSFRVLYTDQFDRFSAPIENRYSRAEVAGWLDRAALTDTSILGGAGWRASGRRAATSVATEESRSPEHGATTVGA
jgi:SAM-dependent methyltransferase/uncharacterized protein YbaR (Trm112 family)